MGQVDSAGSGARSGSPPASGGTGNPAQPPATNPPSSPSLPPPPAVNAPPASALEMACATRDPGPSPIRRLTRSEYDNTLRDLLGDTTRPSAAFPPDERGAGFTNDAENLSVSPLHAQNYLEAAERVVARAVGGGGLARLVTCDPARGDAACGARFIDSWGQRAWRRPLDAQEKTSLGQFFTAQLAAHGFAAAVEMTMQAMLQSPQFLYRGEFGAGAAGGGFLKLSHWEMASRLSYLLWGTMPDADLFAAAQASKLGTREEVAAQARRMIQDDRARQVMATFHEQWLDLVKIDDAEKDTTAYPGFDPAMRALVRREADLFVEDTLWSGDGKLASLLTAPHSFMNARLAVFYGVSGPTGDSFQRVALNPAQRPGLLTRPGVLAAHALANQTDPVRRGKFIREQFFCQLPPNPPPELMIRPPDLDPNLTTRERFAQHASDQSCAACHRLMDPLGLGFENFDAVGRWRDVENDKPVDASGAVFDSDVDGPFVGAAQLAGKLAGSAQVRECVVKQWFRFGYGRSETPQDRCSIETLKSLYASAGHDVRQLVVALTQTDAFMYRRAGGAQ